MSDPARIQLKESTFLEVDPELFRGPKGDKGDAGDVRLICGAFKPRLTLNGQDVALAYASQLGITRELRGSSGGVLLYEGNIQFHGVIPCPDAEVTHPTALIFWLPSMIAGACGVGGRGIVTFKSNLWPSDANHPSIPAFALRGGGGNNWCYVDGLPLSGNTNPTQLGLRDLNFGTQLHFSGWYPTD